MPGPLDNLQSVEAVVGRSAELEALQRVLTADGPRSVVVNGHVGVGKTRLLHEIAALATDRGWMVLKLYGSRPLRSIPLGIVSHLVRDAPGSDPGQVFHAAMGRLRAEARGRQILLAVDDCHELDGGSAAFIHQLVVRGEARSVMAKRAESSSPELVAAMWSDGVGEMVDLLPLDRPSSDQYIRQTLGGAVDPALLEEFHRIALGNPLFLVNALHAAKEGRSVVRRNGVWHMVAPLVSRRLHELVLSRAHDLPTGAGHALSLVAVGGPVPIDLFERVAPPGALTALVERGLVITSGLVTTNGAEPPFVTAMHPLYAEIFAARLTPKQRKEVLIRLAAACLDTAEEENRLARLQAALWLLEADENLGHDLALQAAGEALFRLDYELAERLAAVALDAEPGSVPAAVTLAKALSFQGRGEEALGVLESLEADAADELTEIALARGHLLAFVLARPGEAARLITEAAGRVDGDLRARLHAEQALYMAMAGDFRAVFTAANAVFANPDAAGATRLAAYVNYGLAIAMTGLLDDFDDVMAAAMPLAREHSVEMPLAGHQLGLAYVAGLSAAGRLSDAEHLAGSEVEKANAAGSPNALWLAWLGYVHGVQGHLDRAIEAQTRALALFEVADPFRLLAQSTGLLALHRAQTGHLPPNVEARLEEAALQAGNETRLAVWVGRARAWVEAMSGELEMASSLAQANGIEAIVHDHIAWGVEALHDAARFGSPSLVRRPIEEAVAGTAGAHLLEAMRDHVMALDEGDSEWLHQVAVAFGARGSPLLAAEASAQLAQLHLRRGSVVDAHHATLRSQLWHHRCLSAQTPALQSRPGGFPPRKLDVIHHAAQGLTSREIADRLFVSPRTVDNHLRDIYRVLDIKGRHELADLVADPLREDPAQPAST